VVAAARAVTREGQRVSRGTLLRAREALFLEAEALGNKPHGEITINDYPEFEEKLRTQDFEISIDPDDAEEASQPDATPKKRKAKRKSETNGSDADPSMTASASNAGGHPIVDQELPGAADAAQERAFAQEMEEEDELERRRQFREESRRNKADVDDTNGTMATEDGQPDYAESAPPTAPEDSSGQDDSDDDAASDAGSQAAATDEGPQRLVDPNDEQHWNDT
jgi:putative transposase